MCFAPEADVVAAVAIGAVGVDALRHVRDRAAWPLAALPVLFAAHTLTEAFVWWGVRGDFVDPGASAATRSAATAVYLAFAFVILPVYVPVVMLALERSPARQRAGAAVLAAGVVCAAWLAAALVTGPVRARADEHHITYTVDLWAGSVPIALYLVSTCGVLLLSGQPFLRRFGAVNLVAVAALAWVSTAAVTSLWCLWAAATSVSIAWHLRARAGAPGRPNLADR
ncbi:hypothetical protein CC117_01575 [Parafrankia colletiae]|uniref:Uncharacterized protein n=1 Tax=Parafrankia colletiae TaxID=573497 RepID=A0A1S1RHU7_9ACTN|nr:DUF6629 family protein [Parafrankia colletiae]MCK9899761.1 hypothetical protein [Frankia sp. Cpl3]OHV46358.1 hypothetical protein CC117_01575 [Parafrankia colletiae]